MQDATDSNLLQNRPAQMSLLKSGLISQVGDVSMTMYLRKGKKHSAAAMRERSEKKCVRNRPTETNVSEEGGRGDSAASPWKRPW